MLEKFLEAKMQMYSWQGGGGGGLYILWIVYDCVSGKAFPFLLLIKKKFF